VPQEGRSAQETGTDPRVAQSECATELQEALERNADYPPVLLGGCSIAGTVIMNMTTPQGMTTDKGAMFAAVRSGSTRSDRSAVRYREFDARGRPMPLTAHRRLSRSCGAAAQGVANKGRRVRR
jgi:hypothetical protein